HAVEPPYQAGILVIGQAAHRIAPFAAQGMNLAWRDARSLVAELVRAEEAKIDFGSIEWLQGYWRGRRADHRRVRHFTEQLPRLFESRDPLARWMRRSGWRMVRMAPSVRRTILRFGLGWRL
ncbi:ubiquinone biosynthesis hydroxylase, UbiH/UbiF/VisC/COQ6, partial [mine drainage metagenome]